MPKLKDSRTAHNLIPAFAGESQARNRYTYFASIAKKEGYVQIANIFEETANQQKEHAKRLMKLLNTELKGETIYTEGNFPVMMGTTVECLKSAAAGENEEWTDMYPSFAEIAKEEGFDKIAKLFEEVGLTKGNAFVLSNGDSILLRNEEARLGPRIHVDDIYVDGNDISGLSTAVLRDRQILSEDGMVSVLISMDSRTGCLLNKPIIMSRGFVYMKDSTEMIREAELLVGRHLSTLLKRKTTFGEIKNTIRDTLGPYFYQKTKRNPMIIPVIMNKKV